MQAEAGETELHLSGLMDATAAVKKPESNTEARSEAPTTESAAAQAVPVDASPATAATEPAPATTVLENILRVDAGRIDSVLNLVGELIIGKSMLATSVKRIFQTLSERAVAR